MNSALIRKYGQETLEIAKVPMPEISENDVLVKIVAASINPIDLKTQAGKMKMLLKYQMPLILGSDFSGVIVEVGSNISDFQKGDKVYSRVQKDRIGTFAEYIAVDQTDIARKPTNLTFEEAASIPLVGLTSYQALYDIMQLTAQDKVLIQAGSGGIGTIAIQLAKLTGAYVATTTSTKNVEFVKQLGADKVIDYKKQKFEEELQAYDYIFDTMGGDILKNAFKIVKPGGKVVTISGIPNEVFAKEYGLPLWKQFLLKVASWNIRKLEKATESQYIFLFMKPSGAQLALLTDWFEQDKIHPVIDQIVSLEEIQKGIDRSRSGRAKGKIIVRVDQQTVNEK
ncbi:NADP-dependent oxidoreductase [Enterococcus wangshanyuanii]|nr:NADP-dependent oxidoreductase [Enterococcus wangshanyuanii]